MSDVFSEAHVLGTFDHRCTCCDRSLSGRRVRWLELDQRTNTYHDFGGVPDEKSQGSFPFGLACAKKLVAAAKLKREASQ